MINFRLTQNSIRQDIQNIRRLGSSAGRRYIQRSLAFKFLEITRRNFGSSGMDRPEKWPPLSERYAKKVGHHQATLRKSGNLLASIKIGLERDKYSEVSTDVDYAMAQMFGYKPNNLPARPYFPVEFRGQQYRLTFMSDRQLWEEAKRRIQQVTRGTLQFSASAPWTRSTFERHPIRSPIS